jgi:hypothetical protein
VLSYQDIVFACSITKIRNECQIIFVEYVTIAYTRTPQLMAPEHNLNVTSPRRCTEIRFVQRNSNILWDHQRTVKILLR